MLKRLLPLLLLGVLPACTQLRQNPNAAKQQQYQQLATQAHPGMTRQQLYAILPPLHAPQAEVPRPHTVVGILTLYNPQKEAYALDQNFEVVADFQLADTTGLDAYYEKKAATNQSTSIDSLFPVIVKSQQNPADKLARSPSVRRIGTGMVFSSKDYTR